MTHLYRHFDKSGGLLYVGVSLHAVKRLIAHRQNARWFDEIATMTVERFDSRSEALAAEMNAIKTEAPKYNITHGQRRDAVPDETDDAEVYADFDPMSSLWVLRSIVVVSAIIIQMFMWENLYAPVECGGKDFQKTLDDAFGARSGNE